MFRINKLARLILSGVAVAAFCLGSMMADAAAIVNDLLISGSNTFQDTDAERILRDGQVITSGNFQVGDIVEGVFRFDGVNGITVSDNPGYGPPFSLLAYSQVRVAGIFGSLGGGCNFATDACTIVFTASGAMGPNVTMALYEENSTHNSTLFTTMTPDEAIAFVTGSNPGLIATLGFGEADDYWVANFSATGGPGIIDTLAGLSGASAQVPNIVLGQSVLSNPGALPVLQNSITGIYGSQHDVVGSGSAFAKSTGFNSGWLVETNTTVRFNIQESFNVPEPGSLALLGLVFAGMGAVVYRRKKSPSFRGGLSRPPQSVVGAVLLGSCNHA